MATATKLTHPEFGIVASKAWERPTPPVPKLSRFYERIGQTEYSRCIRETFCGSYDACIQWLGRRG